MLPGAKVCHFSTVHPAIDARIRDRECLTLTKAGAELLLYAVHDRNEAYQGLQIRALPKQTSRLKRFTYAGIAIKPVLDQRPSVIHFHDPELIVIMLRVKKKCKHIKVVFDCHEDSVSHIGLKEYIPRYVKFFIAKMVKYYFKKAALEFDGVITADEGTNAIFKNYGAQPEILFNFPPGEIYYQEPDWNFANRPYDIIYPGCTPRYHLQTMFRTAHALKKRGLITRWLIMAHLDFQDATQWVRDQMEALDLQGMFDFQPVVPLCELPQFLRKAKIGIIPLPNVAKFHSNIPSKLFDFLLSGLPVVLSDLPPSKPFIQGLDIAIPVKPDDAESYADAIMELLTNNARMTAMGRKAREIAFNRYTWETQAPKLIEMYKKLLDRF
jgi:glycosyltransferase involved in cell wall biosynthesis